MFDKNGEEAIVELDPSFYRDLPVRLKIEVGASSQFSEITTVQTLDNLLANGIITPEEYLERLPSGYVPKREEVLARIQQEEVNAQEGAQSMPQPGSDSMNEQQIADVNQLLQGSGTSVPVPQDILAQVRQKYGEV